MSKENEVRIEDGTSEYYWQDLSIMIKSQENKSQKIYFQPHFHYKYMYMFRFWDFSVH